MILSTIKGTTVDNVKLILISTPESERDIIHLRHSSPWDRQDK